MLASTPWLEAPCNVRMLRETPSQKSSWDARYYALDGPSIPPPQSLASTLVAPYASQRDRPREGQADECHEWESHPQI